MNVGNFLIFQFCFLYVSIFSGRAEGVEAFDYEIKAAYLYNFARFTEWPKEKIEAGKPFFICTTGKDPFSGSLDKLISGKTIKDSPLQSKYFVSLDQVETCHIVFIQTSKNKELLAFLREAVSNHALSVSDSESFINSGGSVQFLVEQNAVTFQINLAAVQESGLKIDARVLKIARTRK